MAIRAPNGCRKTYGFPVEAAFIGGLMAFPENG
jgi:hypothetical protein